MGQVFIEDYVVSFLKQKKAEAIDEPVKLALYGYAEKENGAERFIVYGAACEDAGRSVEEIGEEFFPGYSLIGFVSVYNSEKENVSKYNIFFDDNEAMQDYLLFYNAGSGTSYTEPLSSPFQKTNPSKGVWNKLKLILLGAGCVVVAIALSAIDDYPKMKDFTQTAGQVIVS